MKVGLEQRAGTRQTSPVDDYRAVTLVPAVSEIPSGAGNNISPNVTRLLWNPARSLTVFLATTRHGGMNFISLYLRVFALKLIYHTWQLPNFLNSAGGIVVITYLALCKAVPWLQSCKCLSMQKVTLDTHWTSSNAASLCCPMVRSVSGDAKTFWLKRGRKQNCYPALQEHQPTIELGLISLSLSEGHDLQCWCGRDKFTHSENAPEKIFKLFFLFF